MQQQSSSSSAAAVQQQPSSSNGAEPPAKQLAEHHDDTGEADMDVMAEGEDDEGGEGYQVVGKGGGKNNRQSAGSDAAKEQVVFIRAKAGKRNLLKLNQLQLSKLMREAAPGCFSHIHASGKDCLKVYCENTAQKAKLLKVEALGDIPVEVSEPQKGYHRESVSQTATPARHLRGVIKGVARNLPDEEIATATKVLKAVRIKKYVNGRQENTSAVLLIFHEDVVERPAHVFLGYFRIPVHEFHPAPTKCNVCQEYGHIGRSCWASVRCAKCAGNHRADACSAQLSKCANCRGPHPAAYKGCPKFQVAKVVTTLAAKQGLSYAAAVKRYGADQRKAAAAARAAGGRPAGAVEQQTSTGGAVAGAATAEQRTAGGPSVGGPAGGQAAAGGPTAGGPNVGGATADQAARGDSTAERPATRGPSAGGQAAEGLTAGARAEAGGPTTGGQAAAEAVQTAAPKNSGKTTALKRERGSSTDSTSPMRTKVQRGATNACSSESSEDEDNGEHAVKMTLDSLRPAPLAGSAPSRRKQRAARRKAADEAAAALAAAEQAAATHIAAAEHARAQAAAAEQAAAAHIAAAEHARAQAAAAEQAATAQAAALAAKTVELDNMQQCMQKICSFMLQLLQKADLIRDDDERRQMSKEIGELMLQAGIFTEARPL